MGSSFGHVFRLVSFGESHGLGVGVVLEGCPPGMALDLGEIQEDLDRRRPGGRLASARQEKDQLECKSGLEGGVSLGSPLSFWVANVDVRRGDYDGQGGGYRPSHADYTTEAKYGLRARSGGGRASARETVARVIAGSVAKQVLAKFVPQLEVVAYVEAIHTLAMSGILEGVRQEDVEGLVRCPDGDLSRLMEARILEAKREGDSLGGCIRCLCRGVPAGLGEPVFDKLEADLGKAMLSIPAVKAFEVGSGFAGTEMLGSEHNDSFTWRDGEVRTVGNRSGGIQGGMSNGELISMRVGFKPVASIGKKQETVDSEGRKVRLEVGGRHDPCVVPRAVPIVEAMARIVLLDHYLRQQTLLR